MIYYYWRNTSSNKNWFFSSESHSSGFLSVPQMYQVFCSSGVWYYMLLLSSSIFLSLFSPLDSSHSLDLNSNVISCFSQRNILGVSTHPIFLTLLSFTAFYLFSSWLITPTKISRHVTFLLMSVIPSALNISSMRAKIFYALSKHLELLMIDP